MKSKTVPCHSLLPDLVDTETTPAPRPNSAEKTPFNTLNSRTDSTDGATMTVLKVNSLLSMPSISQPLVLACWPSALKFDAPRGLKVLAPDRFSPACPGVTPGTRYTSVAKLRPFSGSSRIAFSSMTVPTSDESVLTSGADATTLVVSVMAPTSSVRVDAGAIVHLDDDALAHVLLEAGELDRDLVRAGHEKRRGVGALGVGDGRGGDAFRRGR